MHLFVNSLSLVSVSFLLRDLLEFRSDLDFALHPSFCICFIGPVFNTP